MLVYDSNIAIQSKQIHLLIKTINRDSSKLPISVVESLFYDAN